MNLEFYHYNLYFFKLKQHLVYCDFYHFLNEIDITYVLDQFKFKGEILFFIERRYLYLCTFLFLIVDIETEFLIIIILQILSYILRRDTLIKLILNII